MSQDRFIKLLWELVEELDIPAGDSLVEKYVWFSSHSEKKENCTYSKKIKTLFFRDQYSKVKEKLLEINRLMVKLEEEDG